MNSIIKWVVAAVAIVLIVWLGYSSFSGDRMSNETESIKIGFIAPLTGDAAAYGEPIQNAVTLAIKEINAMGGINGRPVEMIYENGKCSGKDAANAAQKLVNIDKVKYMIAGVCSAEAFGFEPIVTAAKVFVLMPGASAPKLAGLSPFLMRNNPNDNQVGAAAASYIHENYTNVAIISEKTDYAQGLKEVFLSKAQEGGLSVVSVEDYDTATTDFRTLLTRVKVKTPESIFINAQTGAQLVRIAQQARQIGITASFISGVFNDPETVGAGDAVHGMVLVVPQGLATDAKGAEFVAQYKATYGTEPAFASYAGAAYDDAYLLKQAIETVGDDTEKVQEYLHSLENYTGTLGTYGFDQNGDPVGLDSVFQRIENGKVINL